MRFLSGIHFPAGVPNTPSGPLYGIDNFNRGCESTSDNRELFERPRSLQGSGLVGAALACRPDDTRGCAIGSAITIDADLARRYARSPAVATNFGIVTGKTDVLDIGEPLNVSVNPGGFALYRSGQVVGAVGVAGVAPDVAEFAAFVAASGTSAATGLSPLPVNPLPAPGAILIEGLRLPFFGRCTRIECIEDAIARGRPSGAAGSFQPRRSAPRAARRRAGDIGLHPRAAEQQPGWGGLSAAEVSRLVSQAVARANVTRAQVRLPLTQTAKVVDPISDQAGEVLAIFAWRMPWRMPSTSPPPKPATPTIQQREGYACCGSSSRPTPTTAIAGSPSPRRAGLGAHESHAQFRRPAAISARHRFGKGATPGPWFDLFV